jgi:hypothetical protein
MTIGEFLLSLATDPKALERFRASPREFSREAGLDESQLEVVLAADLSELRVKVEAELTISGEHVAFITIHGVPTPPTPPRSAD